MHRRKVHSERIPWQTPHSSLTSTRTQVPRTWTNVRRKSSRSTPLARVVSHRLLHRINLTAPTEVKARTPSYRISTSLLPIMVKRAIRTLARCNPITSITLHMFLQVVLWEATSTHMPLTVNPTSVLDCKVKPSEQTLIRSRLLTQEIHYQREHLILS